MVACLDITYFTLTSKSSISATMLQYHSILLFKSCSREKKGSSWWEKMLFPPITVITHHRTWNVTADNVAFYQLIMSLGASSLYFLCFVNVWNPTAVFLCPHGRTVTRSGRLPPSTHLTSAGSVLECPRCAEIKSAPRRPAAFLVGKYSSPTELGHPLSAWQLDMRGDILSWFQQWKPNTGHHSAPRRTHRNHTSLSVTSIFIYASCARSFSACLFSLPWKLSPGMSGGLSGLGVVVVGGVVTLALKFLIV